MTCHFSKPELIWSVTEDENLDLLPEQSRYLWLGEDFVLIMSPKKWYIANIERKFIGEVDQPVKGKAWKTLNPACAGIKEFTESERAIINECISSEYCFTGYRIGERERLIVDVKSKIIDSAHPKTLVTDPTTMKQQATIGELWWRLSTMYEHVDDKSIFNREEGSSALMMSHTLRLAGQEIGTFLSYIEPHVAFDEDSKRWLIFVQRADFGMDVYEVSDLM